MFLIRAAETNTQEFKLSKVTDDEGSFQSLRLVTSVGGERNHSSRKVKFLLNIT